MVNWRGFRRESYGQVTKADTFDEDGIPIPDGLFCQKIFGPIMDWTCACGRKQITEHPHIICAMCGVEFTQASSRQERFGHIELVVPVFDWQAYRCFPVDLGLALRLYPNIIRDIVNRSLYIIVDPGNTPLAKQQWLKEKTYQDYRSRFGDQFIGGTGTETLRLLFEHLNYEERISRLQRYLLTANTDYRKKLQAQILELKKLSANPSLDTLFLEIIPVIPPDLRTDDEINKIYSAIIKANNHLRGLAELDIPESDPNVGRRILQLAANWLFKYQRKK